jgi:hypothetical protein
MLVDAGWAPLAADGRREDIPRFSPEANIPAIIACGKAKGIKVLLWVEWRVLDISGYIGIRSVRRLG